MAGFLFLDPGADVTRRDVYARGRALGMRVVLVSSRIGWERDQVDDWVEANPAEPAAVLAALAGREPPAGVVNCSESCLATAAAIAEMYGLPGLSSEVVRRCRDKVLMGACLIPDGIPMARRFVLHDPAEAAAGVAAVGVPGVLKPSTGVASLFTVRFETVAELAAYVRTFNAQLAEHRPASLRDMDGRWLVEEFLDGPAFSVESVVVDGLVSHIAVCEKGPVTGPFFREIGHSTPPRLSTVELSRLRELAERSIHRLGIDNCVTHAEFKVTADGPRLLEIGARMGGGSIRQVVYHATGVDLLEVTLELAMRRAPAPVPVQRAAAASRSLYPKTSGRVVWIDRAGLAGLPGVVNVNVWLEHGEEYRLPPHGHGEVLGVVTTSADVETALRLAEAAIVMADQRTALAR